MAASTRRRAEVLDEAIREAVRAELADHGYAGVTFEGVARRARTSKPVLYRRYRSRAHLVSDALSWHLRTMTQPPSTGALRTDLVDLLRPFADQVRTVGPATFRALLAEADDELLAVVSALKTDLGVAALRRVVVVAAERGEIGSTPVPDAALLAPVAMLRVVVLEPGPALDAADVEARVVEVVDDVALPLITTLAAR